MHFETVWLTGADFRLHDADRFSLSTAGRTAKLGLLFGLAYGGVQDLVGLARGRPIGYVETVRRRFGSASGHAAGRPPPDASAAAATPGDDGQQQGLMRP